jgi:hypothetical protein
MRPLGWESLLCIWRVEVKPLVPPRKRRYRRKSKQVFLYDEVMPQGLEHGVTYFRGDGGSNLNFFIITDIPSDICRR